MILLHMFSAVETGLVRVPLWDEATNRDQTLTNQKFLREYVVNLLSNAFKNLTRNQVMAFVVGLFETQKEDLFKANLRDFLVQLKEFKGDNEELYLEEKEAAIAAQIEAESKRVMSIPGLLPQNELPDDMND